MSLGSTPVQPRRYFRQATQPTAEVPGAVWVTEQDGAGSDTTSRYVYNPDADVWELDSAVGPSKPTAGTLVAGATWRDESTGLPKQYDGTQFVPVGKSDAQVQEQALAADFVVGSR